MCEEKNRATLLRAIAQLRTYAPEAATWRRIETRLADPAGEEASELRLAVDRLPGDTARLDAEVLLAACLGKPRSHLHAWPELGKTFARYQKEMALDFAINRQIFGTRTGHQQT